jgi:ferredoxin-NADP reductase
LADRGTPIVLFAGGSGITPVISLAKTALAKTDRSLLLVYANRDAQSVIFAQELSELQSRYGERLQVVHRHDDRDGFLEVEAARAWAAGSAQEADFYICGPGPYMDVVERALELESVSADRIFIERFVSPEVEALDQQAPHAQSDAGARVIIRLDGAETEVIVGEGETILEAAHRAGLDAPCACLEGYCGACVAQVKSGSVEMRLNDGGVDDEQAREGWVLTCQGELRSAKATIVYPDPD